MCAMSIFSNIFLITICLHALVQLSNLTLLACYFYTTHCLLIYLLLFTHSIIYYLFDLEYSERLQILDMPTLIFRRARGDMVELFFHAYDRTTLSKSFKPRDRLSRQHQFQLMPNKDKDGLQGIQNNSFYHRTIDAWTHLPRKVVNAADINGFKNQLDEYCEYNPLKYCTTIESDSYGRNRG